MNTSRRLRFVTTSLSIVAFALVFASCKPKTETKSETPDGKPGSPEARKTETVSAEKNSFHDVTSKLDAGGDFYLYWSTEQFLTGLSGKVGELEKFVVGFPSIESDDREKIENVFQVVENVVKNSGIEQVSGLGMSSIATSPGNYRTTAILHHYKGTPPGYLWTMLGAAPHSLEGFDLLPTNTAMATFSDLDLLQVWDVVNAEIEKLGIPEATKATQQLPAMFQKQTGLNLDEVLKSLGGEYGIILTLDESKKVAIPGGQGMEVPAPALLIAVKVKDDLIYNRVAELTKAQEQVVRIEKDGFKMLTMPVPLPLPIVLRPSLARYGDYLLIASSDELIQEVVAVKSGKKPGFKSTEIYKTLFKGLPEKGNNFYFMNQTFGQAMMELQERAMGQNNELSQSQLSMMRSFFGMDQPAHALAVAANTDEGWMAVGNGNKSANKVVLLPLVVAPAGLVAAIAIPNFVKARETAQMNACVNNLRQIDFAKQQWAIEHKKAESAVPIATDLCGAGRYMRATPTCPAGGTYGINAVNESPTCSNSRHKLPE